MKQTNVIGDGSSYDADMTIIESFVRHYNKKDEISTAAVFMYYYSQLLNYWSYFEEKLRESIADPIDEIGLKGIGISQFYSGTVNDETLTRSKRRKKLYGSAYSKLEDELAQDPQKFLDLGLYSEEDVYQHYFPLQFSEQEVYSLEFDEDLMNVEDLYPRLPIDFIIRSHFTLDKKRFILQNLDFYKQRFLILIDVTQNNFKNNNEFRLAEIAYIFKYVSTLICYDPRVESLTSRFIKDNYYVNNYYLLPNNTGLFGFNSYLYAFFNNILLIGVPNQSVTFDATTGCPIKFMDHDYFHSTQIVNFMKKTILLREIYFSILSQNYDRKFKELLILVLWILIHEELQGPNLENYISTLNPNFLDTIYKSLLKSKQPYILEFHEEFYSFAHIVTSEDSKELVLDLFPQANFVFSDPLYFYLLVIFYGLSYIIKHYYSNTIP